MARTCFVAVPFDRDEEGIPKPGEAEVLPSARVAVHRADELANTHAGAVAFARTGDKLAGELGDLMILVECGDVNLEALHQ